MPEAVEKNNKKIYLRNVSENDIDLLFAWANDPLVRANSFSTEPIPYEDHKKWFSNLIKDENRRQYILMEDEEAVGQIRFSINGEEAEIGYSISPAKRGCGYGQILLELAKTRLKEDRPKVTKLTGRVKKGNRASEACFEKCGFAKVSGRFEYNY